MKIDRLLFAVALLGMVPPASALDGKSASFAKGGSAVYGDLSLKTVGFFDPPPGEVAPDPSTGVRMVAQPMSCKRNSVTWRRPRTAIVPCGVIESYKIFRNDLIVGALGFGDGQNCTSEADTRHYSLDLIWDGSGFGRNGDVVDEGSTHRYQVRAYDANGVEVSRSPYETVANPMCPDGPRVASLNVTLVTFRDVVDARCESYPCFVPLPAGAPFTVERAMDDLFSTGAYVQTPLAWLLQQSSPDKPIGLTGTVRGWVVLDRRDTYCTYPYRESCASSSVMNLMEGQVRKARGSMPPARADGYYFYGIQGRGPSANANYIRWYGQDPAISGFPITSLYSGSLVAHELGHVGFFDDVSIPLWHSAALVCPHGAPPVGPDLRDLTRDHAGTHGSCDIVSHRDFLDLMSNGVLLSAQQRWLSGMIDRRHVHTVPYDSSEVVTLPYLNTPGDETAVRRKLLRVALEPNPDDTSYLVEYHNGEVEADYRPLCTATPCLHPTTYREVAQGLYLQLKVRNGADLSSGQYNLPIPTVMLTAGNPHNRFLPLVLTPDNPTYCDRYRNVSITLLGFETVDGVDQARIAVQRGVACQ